MSSPNATGLMNVDGLPPATLSRQLRTERGGFLRMRRGIVASSLAAAGAMGVVSLFQTGLLRRLPDLPGRLFDAERVDASEEAYAWFSTPDGLLGLASYAGTAVLAAMGGRDRARRVPWVPLVLAGKAGLDAVQAANLSVDQWTKHRAFCVWCLAAAGASFATAALAVPEARAAWQILRAR